MQTDLSTREFLIAHGLMVARMERDEKRMTAAAFSRKYGVEVREGRRLIRRLKSSVEGPDDAETRSIVRLFSCICERLECRRVATDAARERLKLS